MLLNFGFRNFFSFKEGAEISFELDSQVPESISRGKNFSTVLCVKGANASGKTNILRGLSFISYFTAHSFDNPPGQAILVSSHFGNKEPIDFFIEFIADGSKYFYEVSLTEKEVLSEVIYRTKSKKTKVLERKNEKVIYAVKEWKNFNHIKLRKNASVISTAKQYGFSEVDFLVEFFEKIISNVTYAGLRANLNTEAEMSELLTHDKNLSSFVRKFISECDVGVMDVSLHERVLPDGNKTFFPLFHHEKSGKILSITSLEESSGTRALFRSIALYKIVLDLGGVLIADEFDIHLHPHILPKILAMFLDAKKNKKNAQLIFTTHNSAILDVMGRYRTYLVEKRNNESFTYRLDEIPGDILRNDRPISPVYREGKIGGVPRL
jgi:uncharacterized protein